MQAELDNIQQSEVDNLNAEFSRRAIELAEEYTRNLTVGRDELILLVGSLVYENLTRGKSFRRCMWAKQSCTQPGM